VAVAGFELAREVLRYAVEELEKAVKLGDILLYRNAADKVFLALVIAVNAYIAAVEGVEPTSHAERRKILRKMGREDLRTIYSDLMKTHEEAFYHGFYQPDEVQYAVKKVEEVIAQLEEEVGGGADILRRSNVKRYATKKFVALRILAVATLLAAAALGLGVVEKSLFVAVPRSTEAVCIDQDVFYLMSDGGAGVAVSALNGSLLGYIKIPDRVDCIASRDKLYLLTEDGLYVFDKTLRELQRVKLNGRIYIPLWGPPSSHKIHVLTLREDKLYVVVHRIDGVFLVVLDADNLRLLETYRLASEDCIDFYWGLARGDEVVAYGRCFIDGHNTAVIVRGSERKTVESADLVLSLRGQLYVASGTTLTILDGGISRSFPNLIVDIETDGRYIYVLYRGGIAKLTPQLDLVAEAHAAYYPLDLEIRGDRLYLTVLNNGVNVKIVRLGNYTTGRVVFCYLAVPLFEIIGVDIGGELLADRCCISREVLPGWHLLEFWSSGELKRSYVVYVEPGRTTYLIDVDPATIYIAAAAVLFAYLLVKPKYES
jgi:hypothetical protein